MKTAALLLMSFGFFYVARAEELKPLNVQCMLRGYCFAGSRPDKNAPCGYGPSDNAPRKLASQNLGKQGEISLLVIPESSIRFGHTNQGLRVLLVNRTRSEAAFDASDSRLSIIQEAQDAQGQWHPIEYLPSSWCGNSHHRVFLPAGHFWEFAAPVYSGLFKTRLRFVLQGKKPIYSSVFAGSINPEQFTIKQGHQPTNLMDPYNE